MKNCLALVLFLFSFFTSEAQTQRVVIETDSGKIVLALFDNTPLHRDNMVKLVNEHFFDSLLFHRVIPGFVAQGGDPESKRALADKMLGDGDLAYKIPAEINDSNFHRRGALGMARDNNPEMASSASQFYIVTGRKYSDAELDQIAQRGRSFSPAQREVYKTEGGTPSLDGKYTVYGFVVEGMDVVDKISAMPRNGADRPVTDVRMLKVYLFETPKGNRKNKKKK